MFHWMWMCNTEAPRWQCVLLPIRATGCHCYNGSNGFSQPPAHWTSTSLNFVRSTLSTISVLVLYCRYCWLCCRVCGTIKGLRSNKLDLLCPLSNFVMPVTAIPRHHHHHFDQNIKIHMFSHIHCWYLSAAKAAGYIYGAIRVLLRSRLSTDNNAHNPIILSCKNTGRWKYHSVMGQLDRSRVQSDFFD